MKFIIIIMMLAISTLYAQELITLVVQGRGISKEEAIKDALRKAVEQSAGTEIFSDEMVQNFAALKDTLISHNFGMITAYKILSEINIRPNYEVEMSVTVANDIKQNWQKIRVLLQQKGNPTVAFCIQETLDGKIVEGNYGEYVLIQEFKRLGFKVLNRQAFKKTLTNDELMLLAAQNGAQLLVVGLWEGQFRQIMDGPGNLQYIVHSYNVATKIYQTDSQQIIASVQKSHTDTSESLLFTQDSAGKNGFARLVKNGYAQLLAEDLIKFWIQDIQTGTDITVEIGNISFQDSDKVLELLQSLGSDIIASAEIDVYRDKRLVLAIKSKISLKALAKKISDIPGFPLEVSEFSQSKLELSWSQQQNE